VHPPLIVLGYRGRILRAPNLHKKIEYTARIAPAQLGKATVKRYRRPATGWACFSGLSLSSSEADMGIQASILSIRDQAAIVTVAVLRESDSIRACDRRQQNLCTTVDAARKSAVANVL